MTTPRLFLAALLSITLALPVLAEEPSTVERVKEKIVTKAERVGDKIKTTTEKVGSKIGSTAEKVGTKAKVVKDKAADKIDALAK